MLPSLKIQILMSPLVSDSVKYELGLGVAKISIFVKDWKLRHVLDKTV